MVGLHPPYTNRTMPKRVHAFRHTPYVLNCEVGCVAQPRTRSRLWGGILARHHKPKNLLGSLKSNP